MKQTFEDIQNTEISFKKNETGVFETIFEKSILFCMEHLFLDFSKRLFAFSKRV